jgi:hypothetical protein
MYKTKSVHGTKAQRTHTDVTYLLVPSFLSFLSNVEGNSQTSSQTLRVTSFIIFCLSFHCFCVCICVSHKNVQWLSHCNKIQFFLIPFCHVYSSIIYSIIPPLGLFMLFVTTATNIGTMNKLYKCHLLYLKTIFRISFQSRMPEPVSTYVILLR